MATRETIDRQTGERIARLHAVIDDCLQRQRVGEPLVFDEVVAAHPDLGPELADELRKLAFVAGAWRRAAETVLSPTLAPGPDASPRRPAPPDALPDSFAGYQLLHEVQRGGQGVVYQAIQKSTKRNVAIKVMKEGPFAGPADKARFEREVHVLAALNHPNIVTIYDSGVTSDSSIGRFHFFVMDFISGQPLDVYMAAAPRSVEATLRLFATICEAVDAAHVRGVIHRDLKPGNIRIDDRGQPHILDFGLAKVAESFEFQVSSLEPPDSNAGAPMSRSAPAQRGDAVSARSLKPETRNFTQTGQFIGSLPWASPEQAQGQPDKVDIRTDVYSLGVLLYQMLTGKFPYDVIGNMRDVLDRIMAAEPIRPRTLRRQIDDEVETIVLRCLAKERERRYQSAGELGRDVRRYLAGEPIEAKRDSASYLLRKALLRYRLPASLAAAFVLLIVAGLIVTLAAWRQTDRARVEEEQQRKVAELRRDQALAAERDASQRRTEAETITKLLQQMLSSADPQERGRDYTVRQLLDEFSAGLGDQLKGQPQVEAAIRSTIGTAYGHLGETDAAAKQVQAALDIRRRLFGPEHELVAESLSDWAAMLRDQADIPAALAVQQDVVAMQRRLLGDEHADVAKSLATLADLLCQTGRFDEAAERADEAVRMTRKLLGDDHPNLADVLTRQVFVMETRGEYRRAEPLAREGLSIVRKAYGDHDARVAWRLDQLATLLKAAEDLAGAEPLARESLDIYRNAYGEEHVAVGTAYNNLAQLLNRKGDKAAAETLFRKALDIFRKKLAPNHPRLASTLNNLASILHDKRDYDAAEALYRESLAMFREIHGNRHTTVATTLTNLGGLLRAKGDPPAAESAQREALALAREIHGDSHPLVINCLNNLAASLAAQRKLDEAEPLRREALALCRTVHGSDHEATARTLDKLAELMATKRDYDQAEPFYRECIAIYRKLHGDENALVSGELSQLGMMLVRKTDYAGAGPVLDEALAILRKQRPADDQWVTNTQVWVALVLVHQRKFADAEQLLLDTHRVLVGNATVSTQRMESLLKGIVGLYEAWDAAEPGGDFAAKAAEWRARMQAATQPSSSAATQPVQSER